MKKSFSIFLIFLVVGVVAYSYKDPLSKAKNYLEGKLFPCSAPITYSIGNLDPKFGLSNAEVVKDLADAAKLWNDAEHKSLFEYVPTGGLVTVNFVFDYRQEATLKLKSLGLTINDDENTYNSLKVKYDNMQQQYLTQKAQLDAMVSAYNDEKSDYDEKVAYWNARGGAPKTEFNKLESQRKDLANKAAAIQSFETTFNQLVDNLNALAQILNQLIAQLNLKVNNYNTVGASAGTEFEEGVFKSSLSSEEIDIYQFDSQEKLLRVLAHELGHAVGLDHIDDQQAIMYRLNQGSVFMLTKNDISAVNQLCSSKFNLSNFSRVTP